MRNKFLTYFENKLSYLTCCLTLFCICGSFCDAQDYVNSQRIGKIVIDPGHGGRQPGAVGKKIKEKDVTLSVSLKLGEMITKNFPDVEVIYTRKKDIFLELHERSNIANQNNADLFISIHVNAFKTSSPRGVSTWVMGMHKSEANLAVAQLENSVITMEDDYSAKYEGYNPNSPESYIMFTLMQNAHIHESLKLAELVQNELLKTGPIKGDKGVQQAGFLVLWKTAMPSILIELGFISNPNDEAILMQTENHTKLAKSIFDAFSKYKQEYEKNYIEPTVTETPAKTANNKTDTVQKNAVDNVQKDTTTEKNNTLEVEKNLPEQKNTEEKTTKNDTPTNNKPAETNNKPAETVKAPKTYSVQIMAIYKLISTTAKDFKGHKNVRYMKIGAYYKYMIGNFTDLNQARQFCRSLQKDFQGAFVVEVEENNLKPVR